MNKNYLELENDMTLYLSKAMCIQEYIKLKQKVDKAIKYIEEFDYYIPEDDIPELINILKGEEND